MDHSYGCWNAPVEPASGRFVYVPIPEGSKSRFHPGLERRYDEVLPALNEFCADHNRDLRADLRFPTELLSRPMHLDPDFSHLTYGDVGALIAVLNAAAIGGNDGSPTRRRC